MLTNSGIMGDAIALFPLYASLLEMADTKDAKMNN